MSEQEKHKYHLVILGDSGVGKSNLLLKFTKQEFSNNYPSTLGASHSKQLMMVEQKQINLNIWDTAGQERFKSLTEIYCKKAHAIMLVFDVTARHTFENCSIWLKIIRDAAMKDVGIFLVGNQIDLITDDVQVTDQEVEEFVKENCLNAFFQTSALDGTNVQSTFEEIAVFLSKSNFNQIDLKENPPGKKFKGQESDQTITLLDVDSGNEKNRRKKCCCWR